MNRLPLAVRLRREAHRNIAQAQDQIVLEVFRLLDRPVLHGGTAIWRCFGGLRFSEDLDFYIKNDRQKIEALFGALARMGFRILKKKMTDRSLYSELELDRTAVRLEATFQEVHGVLGDYEAADGTFVSVYTLAPEAFIAEKVRAYLGRRRIRDLWDIFFLLRQVRDIGAVKADLGRLINRYEASVDEAELAAVILEGIVPSSKDMLEYITRTWRRANT